MKGLLIASLSIFSVAVAFRLLHWPFASILIILSVFLVLIFAITNSVVRKKVLNISILGGWVVFSWSIYFLFKYMYWNAGPSIIGFNTMFLIVFSITILYISSNLLGKIHTLSKTVLIVSAFGFVFSFIPSYQVCYFFDLNDTLNKEFKTLNYISWDKYSWFLNIRGKTKEALEANNKAINAFNKRQIEYTLGDTSSRHLMILKEHRDQLIINSWTSGYIKFD